MVVASPIASGASIGVPLVGASTAVYLSTYRFALNLHQTETLVFVWPVVGVAQAILHLRRTPSRFWARPYPSPMLLASTAIDVLAVGGIAGAGGLTAPISIGLISSTVGRAAVVLVVADAVTTAPARVGSRPTRTGTRRT